MTFLLDEMLAGLAKWLRAAGWDAENARNATQDRDLVERARREDRVLLTRDRAILDIKGAPLVTHVLQSETMDGWAEELRTQLNVNWLHAPFTRCLMCNVALIPADEAARAALPPRVQNQPGPVLKCPACERLYWPGSHVARMRKRLERFAGHLEADGT